MPAGHPPLAVPEDVRKVIAKMADAAKEKPDDLEVWRQLGFVQYRAGQVDPAYLAAAAATYAHVLDKAPDDLDSLRALGNIAYDRNEPARAMEFYRRYLTIKPDDLGIQTDLATMLLATKQYDEALAAYQAVLRTDPNFFQAQFNLAIAYRAKGDDEQALAALRRAREIATDDATRKRVDALIAHVSGAAPAAAARPPPRGGGAAPPPPPGRGGSGGRRRYRPARRRRNDLPLASDRRLAHRPHRLDRRQQRARAAARVPDGQHAADGARQVPRSRPWRPASGQERSPGHRRADRRAGRRGERHRHGDGGRVTDRVRR
jgi:tetratricopeptide (TPR) repeat protein